MFTLLAVGAVVAAADGGVMAKPRQPLPDGGVEEVRPSDFYRAALQRPLDTASAEEVAQWLSKHEVVLVDVRSREQFAARHLRGAVNLPVTDLTDELAAKVLPDTNARVVIYCDDQLAPTRRIALTTLGGPSLQTLGYRHVLRLEDLWLRPGAHGDTREDHLGGLSFEAPATK
jgi:hypothetical protein